MPSPMLLMAEARSPTRGGAPSSVLSYFGDRHPASLARQRTHELSAVIQEEIHSAATQEARHLDHVEQVYRECDEKLEHQRSSAARKASKLKGRAAALERDNAFADARANELEQHLVLAAAEVRLSRQRCQDLEEEQQRLKNRTPAVTVPLPAAERVVIDAAAELEMERVRHSRDLLSTAAQDARRDANEARQALGRESAVSAALQQDLDGYRHRLQAQQASLADAAEEIANLTRDLEAERVRSTAARTELQASTEAHEATLAALRTETVRTRRQRDEFGEEAAVANAKLRRATRELATRRLGAAAEKIRRAAVAVALRRWARGAALAAGQEALESAARTHGREMDKLAAELRTVEDRQRQRLARAKRVAAGCAVLARVAGKRAAAATQRRDAFVQWRSAAALLQAAEAGTRIEAAEVALRERGERLRRANAEATMARRLADDLREALEERAAAVAAADASAVKAVARAAAAETLVRRLRVAALRRVASLVEGAAATERVWRGMALWREACARMRAADNRGRRSQEQQVQAAGVVAASSPGRRRSGTRSEALHAAAPTAAEAEKRDTTTQTLSVDAVSLSPPSPLEPVVEPAETPEPEETEVAPARLSSPQPSRRSSSSPVTPRRRQPRPPPRSEGEGQELDTDAALAQLEVGDPSALPRLMLMLRVRIGEELYAIGERLLRCVDADHLEVYGPEYAPSPVTKVERLQFSARLGDGARGRLRRLLVIYLRTYESVKALLAARLEDESGAAHRGSGSQRSSATSGRTGGISSRGGRRGSAASGSGGGGGGGNSNERSGANGGGGPLTLAERRAARPLDPDDTDLASLRLGPLATPGDRARAARVLRDRLITLLEDAKDVWMERRRGIATGGGSPTGAVLRAGPRRVRRGSSGRGGGSGGGGGFGGGGGASRAFSASPLPADGHLARLSRAAAKAESAQTAARVASGGADGAAVLLALERRRRAESLRPATAGCYLETGAGPRQYWEAVAGSRFVDADWDVPLVSLERQIWRLAALTRCQDRSEGLRLRRADTQRKVLDQRVYELILCYARMVLIWEGCGPRTAAPERPQTARSAMAADRSTSAEYGFGGGGQDGEDEEDGGGGGVSGGGGGVSGGGGGVSGGGEDEAAMGASGLLELTASDITAEAALIPAAGGAAGADEFAGDLAHDAEVFGEDHDGRKGDSLKHSVFLA